MSRGKQNQTSFPKTAILTLLTVLSLAGCRGDDRSVAAPSGVPNADSAQGEQVQRPKGPFDCVANEAGDDWDCKEVSS